MAWNENNEVLLKACADAFLGDVSARTAVTIGNIPHKSAYTQWAAENMYEMRDAIKVCKQLLFLTNPKSHNFRRVIPQYQTIMEKNTFTLKLLK